MKFLCKIFGHNIYNFSAYRETVHYDMCLRCESMWRATGKGVEQLR